jgi:hypothetical protein
MKIKRGRAIYSDQCAWCDYVFEPAELMWEVEKYDTLSYCSKKCIILDLTSNGEYDPLTDTLEEN